MHGLGKTGRDRRTEFRYCKLLELYRIGDGWIPLFNEEEAPFQNLYMVLERTKIWPWVPKGSETESDCAGGGQHKLLFCLCNTKSLKSYAFGIHHLIS
jgi:hypothetical protein